MYHEEVFFNFSLMNKKDIAGIVLAGAAGLAQANAGPLEPPTECGENQTRTVSAVNGFMGCKDVPQTGKSYVVATNNAQPTLETNTLRYTADSTG